MKKNKVMMKGANLAPSCPMLAMAMSLRTNSTMASTAPANPLGAASKARCCFIMRPAMYMVRNTRIAAMNRKYTCLVGERFTTSEPIWMSGQRGR
jgi:hypothetical protein